jgi:hypothetical protein
MSGSTPKWADLVRLFDDKFLELDKLEEALDQWDLQLFDQEEDVHILDEEATAIIRTYRDAQKRVDSLMARMDAAGM